MTSTMVATSSSQGRRVLPYLTPELKEGFTAQMDALEKGELSNAQARRMLADIAKTAASYVEAHWYEPFLASDHYGYILELKNKEGMVPKLEQFQVIRVLGEGGFGR